MQRSGTKAIRTQIQPSKPKLEITNITNSQNTKRTYGQPSEKKPLELDRCKSKKGAPVSEILALFNCSSGG